MTAKQRKIFLNALKYFDLLVMVFCFLGAAWVSSFTSKPNTFGHFLSIRIKIGNGLLFAGFLGIWHFLLCYFGLYGSRRFNRVGYELIDCLKVVLGGSLVILIIAYLADIKMVTPLFLAVFAVSETLITLGSRITIRFTLKTIRNHDRNLRNIVIAGTNDRAVRLVQKLERAPELGYRVLGFVDTQWDHLNDFLKSGRVLIASFQEFPEFLRKQAVDEVMICLPLKTCYQQASQIVALCEEQGVVVRYLPDLFKLRGAQSKADNLEGDILITMANGQIDGWYIIYKRIFDVIISLLLIIVLSPFLLLTALLIRMTSPGPVLYKQERLSLNKRRFFVYKFRTMVTDADKLQEKLESLNEADGPVFKIKNDPRITPIGKLLRKTSIDELPQFFNVLKGDMSLVGPRPLPVRDFEGFDQDWHRRRFSVKPGLTCLWQVNGRSDLSFDKWMELDLHYIDHRSLWLDLKIMIMTIPAVLKGSGAA